jgi:DNA modification methylase
VIVRANAINIPLSDCSVHCCVTSPPYWGLRKYAGEQVTFWKMSPDGEVDECAFGLEPTIEQYVEHSVLILREVRRVLRDDGICWWNLGDSYAASNRGVGGHSEKQDSNKGSWTPGNHRNELSEGLKPLDLCLIPERVALAAQADGWYVRSLVIWAKPNPMPESVNGWRWERHRVKSAGSTRAHTPYASGASVQGPQSNYLTRAGREGREPYLAEWSDCPGCEKCSPNDGLVLRKGSWRPTDAYEHILMLTKTDDYFGDAEAVKEASRGRENFGNSRRLLHEDRNDCERQDMTPRTSRNLRNVWTFPTQPYPEAHFATFPERLPEICIKASTSERGCCPKCGANWARVMQKSGGTIGKSWHDHENDTSEGMSQVWRADGGDEQYRVETLGWRPSCQCDAGAPVPCTILDPFGGSGTTARVALKLNRRAISVDLAYHKLSRKRMKNIQPVLIGL